MNTILITGGTGMIGKKLSELLVTHGYKVIILTRKIPENSNNKDKIQFALWNIQKQIIDINAIQQADHIIHLAGAGVVDKRWTPAYKKEIIDSRVNSSALLIDTLKNHFNKVKTIISASAIGWYGADESPITPFTEDNKPGTGFLAETCKLWEQSIEPAAALGIRVVKYRFGIVLSNDGGALKKFKHPLQFGIAAILGNGKQMVSWIHVKDICKLCIHALQNNTISGSYNAVAPSPVSNRKLTITLAKAMKGDFYIPLYIPSFILKVILGSKSIEVLKSATVSCDKIRQTGFTFDFSTIQEAINDLTAKDQRS